jgi:hypothetical protein
MQMKSARRGQHTSGKESERRFAVCIKNEGYEASLERNKIYVIILDADAAASGDVRVVDESGEDYLYPADWFVAIEVPEAVEASLLRAS